MVDKSVIGRKLSLVEEHRRRIKGLPALTIEVFKKDTTVQDILLFNLTQAIQNCVDIATHIISDEGWGVPGTQSEIFYILKDRGVVSEELSEKLIAMIGFRNRVIHEYEKLNLDIVYDIWQNRIQDIEKYCLAVIGRFGKPYVKEIEEND